MKRGLKDKRISTYAPVTLLKLPLELTTIITIKTQLIPYFYRSQLSRAIEQKVQIP